MPVVTQMLIKFGIEGRFNGNFGYHPAKVIEITFGFNAFSRFASEVFELFLVHVAYP